MVIKLPGGNERVYEEAKSLFEIAQDISPSLKKRCIVGKVNGVIVDMNTVLSNDSEVVFITESDPEALEVEIERLATELVLTPDHPGLQAAYDAILNRLQQPSRLEGNDVAQFGLDCPTVRPSVDQSICIVMSGWREDLETCPEDRPGLGP